MPKRYKVIGAANVHGFGPGETFLADLDSAHEARMLEGGFLAIAAEKKPAAPQPAAPAEKLEADTASEETPS